MSYDPDFDDDAFDKARPKRVRPRPVGALVVFTTLLVLVMTIALTVSGVEEMASTPATPIVASPAPIVLAQSAQPVRSEPLPYHLIVNRETGQCFDVPYGSREQRTNVEQFPVNGGANQLWRLEPVPRDGVRIVNGQSGMCLDIPFGTTNPHVAVEQFPINGGSNQGWRLEPVGDHWYRIVNHHSGLCLQVASRSSERRAVIEQAVRGDSTYQHWRTIAVH
jgi:hypothetical protein